LNHPSPLLYLIDAISGFVHAFFLSSIISAFPNKNIAPKLSL
jgi:hypothetical protein